MHLQHVQQIDLLTEHVLKKAEGLEALEGKDIECLLAHLSGR